MNVHTQVRQHNRTVQDSSLNMNGQEVVLTRQDRIIPCPCPACYWRKDRRRARARPRKG